MLQYRARTRCTEIAVQPVYLQHFTNPGPKGKSTFNVQPPLALLILT